MTDQPEVPRTDNGGGRSPDEAATTEPSEARADEATTSGGVDAAPVAAEPAVQEAPAVPAAEPPPSAAVPAERVEAAPPAAATAATASVPPTPEPATPEPVTPARVEADDDEPTAGPEQIEWRPVNTGEAIEWQPVVKSAADGGEADPADDAAADEFDDLDAELAALTSEGAASASGAGGGRARAGVTSGRRPATTKPRAVEPSEGTKPGKAKRQVVILSALSLVVVLVAVFGFVLSRGATSKGAAAGGTTSTTSATPGTTVPAAQLLTFHDDLTGFTLKYPKTWNRLTAPVADIRTVLLPGNNNAVQVRILPIQTPADQSNIGNFKAVTDAVVFGDQTAKEVQEQLVTLNGKLCYYYLYTFTDPSTGQTGVHAHYFVFAGYRIYSLVFQALPADQFSRLAAVFDQVAESFTIDANQTTTTLSVSPPTTVS